MDRHRTVFKTHCSSSLLTLQNPTYMKWVLQHTVAEMMRDFGKGDVTAEVCFPKKKNLKAFVVAKESGIMAGEQEIKFLLSNFANIKFRFLKNDGQSFKKNSKILEISGDAHDLMIAERVVLNVLGRMSGIATYTRKFVLKARKILITPTRKTLWGLLDKRACVLGRGGTHRLGLDDAILIKHNHLKAFDENIEKLLHNVMLSLSNHDNQNVRFLEIEVSNIKDALIAAEIFSKAKKGGFLLPCFVMFDNFTPEKIKKALSEIKQKNFYKNVLFEASGGITEKNIQSYAKTGVDVISVGAITHSAKTLDFSMRVFLVSH